MVSLLELLLETGTLKDAAEMWGVTPEQAALRLREVPFVVLSHADVRGGGRGRPARRLALDPSWRFDKHTEGRPLGTLLHHLRTLHALGERFALGVPLTSVYWHPFLHPTVRIWAPPETFSLWNRLFAGTYGALEIAVDVLPPSAGTAEFEGVPVLDEQTAIVDALQEFRRLRNVNLVALADCIAHRSNQLKDAERLAKERGLDGEVLYLGDHRRRGALRVVRPEEARRAHRLVVEFSRVPPGTKFAELLEREAAAGD